MTKRRGYGEGSIDRSGDDTWRIRYRINRQRFTKTVKGTEVEARKELRRLLREGDVGVHVAPDKMTVAEWIEHWVAIGCPGNKRRRQVGARSLERYAELLRCHVEPVLGGRPLQQLEASDFDKLYVGLAGKISARTAHHVHVVLGACIGTAARTGKIAANPMARVEKVPSPAEADHGMVLEEDQLVALVRGFKGSSLFPIVATAAFTGARRGEVLALQWSDLDANRKTLRIERAVEETKAGLKIKGPKKEAHKRTITIDDDLLALLLAERERYLRIVAGVAAGAPVDLSLVKLPADALVFPNSPAPGEDFSFTRLRRPRGVTKEFARKAAALGFPDLRLHDLRGTHETHLLDRGVSAPAVAARCGHDPVTMLRAYAKRTRKADNAAAEIIGAMTRGALK